MAESINPRTAQHDAALESVLDSLLTDVTNIRTKVAALVVDEGKRVSDHNVLIAKLNLDGSVSDTDYAAAASQTSVGAPTALITTT